MEYWFVYCGGLLRHSEIGKMLQSNYLEAVTYFAKDYKHTAPVDANWKLLLSDCRDIAQTALRQFSIFDIDYQRLIEIPGSRLSVGGRYRGLPSRIVRRQATFPKVLMGPTLRGTPENYNDFKKTKYKGSLAGKITRLHPLIQHLAKTYIMPALLSTEISATPAEFKRRVYQILNVQDGPINSVLGKLELEKEFAEAPRDEDTTIRDYTLSIVVDRINSVFKQSGVIHDVAGYLQSNGNSYCSIRQMNKLIAAIVKYRKHLNPNPLPIFSIVDSNTFHNGAYMMAEIAFKCAHNPLIKKIIINIDAHKDAGKGYDDAKPTSTSFKNAMFVGSNNWGGRMYTKYLPNLSYIVIGEGKKDEAQIYPDPTPRIRRGRVKVVPLAEMNGSLNTFLNGSRFDLYISIDRDAIKGNHSQWGSKKALYTNKEVIDVLKAFLTTYKRKARLCGMDITGLPEAYEENPEPWITSKPIPRGRTGDYSRILREISDMFTDVKVAAGL